jgi:hypothetical protein
MLPWDIECDILAGGLRRAEATVSSGGAAAVGCAALQASSTLASAGLSAICPPYTLKVEQSQRQHR